MSNQVTRIADDFFLIRDEHQVAGIIVRLPNGTYMVYADHLAPVLFANLPAALEYVDSDETRYMDTRTTLHDVTGKHSTESNTELLPATT